MLGWIGFGVVAAPGMSPVWAACWLFALVVALHPLARLDKDLRRAQYLAIFAMLFAVMAVFGKPGGPGVWLAPMVPASWFLFAGLADVHGRRQQSGAQALAEFARFLAPAGFAGVLMAAGDPKVAGIAAWGVLFGFLVLLISDFGLFPRTGRRREAASPR